VTATTAAPAAAPAARAAPVARAFRFELVKQLAQWRVRLLILACWIGPAIAYPQVAGALESLRVPEPPRAQRRSPAAS